MDTENQIDALLAIADALKQIARAIDRLGTNNGSTSMGAIEMLAMEVKTGFERLAEEQS